MTTERSPEERADRARRAKELLEEPLIREFFERAKTVAINVFLESRPEDDGVRLRARLLHYATENLEAAFRECMNSGPQAVKKEGLLQMPPPTQPKRRVI